MVDPELSPVFEYGGVLGLSEHPCGESAEAGGARRDRLVSQERVEVIGQCPGAGVSQLGLLLEASQHDQLQIPAHPRIEHPGRHRVLLEHEHHRLDRAGRLIGWSAGQHVVEDGPEAVDIACRRQRSAV